MKKALLLIVILLISMNSLLASEDRQHTPFNLGDVLPRTTLFYAGMDLSKTKDAIKNSNMGALFQNPEMQNFCQPFLEKIMPQIQFADEQLRQLLGAPFAEILAMETGPLDIAILEFDTTQQQPVAVVAVDLSQLGTHLLSIGQRMNIFIGSEEYAGYQSYQTQGFSDTFYVHLLDTTILVSNRKGTNEELIDNYHGKGKNLLSQDEEFVNAYVNYLNGGQEDSILFGAWINLQQILHEMTLPMPPPMVQILKAVQLDKIQDVTFTATIQGKHAYTSFMVRTPKDLQGIPAFFHGAEVNVLEYANKFPTDASLFSITGFRLSSLLESIEKTIRLADPENQMQLSSGYKKNIQLLEKSIGLSVTEDILPAFGGLVAMGNWSVDGGMLPEQITILPIQNQEKAEKIIHTIQSFLGLNARQETFVSQPIFYFSKPLGKLGSSSLENMNSPVEGIFVALSAGLSGNAYCFYDGHLYYASSVHGLRAYLKWKNDTSQSALSGNKSFLNAMSLQSENCTSFTYVDQRKLVRQLYSTTVFLLRSFEGYIRDAGIPLETALLPRASTIVSYLDPAYFAIRSEPDALVMTLKNNLSPIAYCVGIVTGITFATGSEEEGYIKSSSNKKENFEVKPDEKER